MCPSLRRLELLIVASSCQQSFRISHVYKKIALQRFEQILPRCITERKQQTITNNQQQ